MDDPFDVVVVGGGSAGCVLAARLSEDPSRSVCLVEAGPDYGPYEDGRWPAELLDARFLPMTHLWEQEPEDRSASRARVIGGCSAHNACVVLEGAPSDYDEWGPGWTYAELEPYLRRAERELRVRRFEAAELSPWHEAFVEAAGDDAIVHPVNEVGGVRWNAAFAYLDPARGRPNLTIVADTLVDRVLVAGGRATGVATDRGEVAAGTVVLAAGAYGSPAILLRSEIGPETGLPVGEGADRPRRRRHELGADPAAPAAGRRIRRARPRLHGARSVWRNSDVSTGRFRRIGGGASDPESRHRKRRRPGVRPARPSFTRAGTPRRRSRARRRRGRRRPA